MRPNFGQVYDAIRRTNQEVGELVTSTFETIEDLIIIQHSIKSENNAPDATEGAADQLADKKSE